MTDQERRMNYNVRRAIDSLERRDMSSVDRIILALHYLKVAIGEQKGIVS